MASKRYYPNLSDVAHPKVHEAVRMAHERIYQLQDQLKAMQDQIAKLTKS